jgi:hypothetical protein
MAKVKVMRVHVDGLAVKNVRQAWTEGPEKLQ